MTDARREPMDGLDFITWLQNDAPTMDAVAAYIDQQRDTIARLEARVQRAETTLEQAGYTYTEGAAAWKPPLGPSAVPFLDTIDQLQAHMTASEAAKKWTTERPTKEGWYWYRSIGDPADIVQVYESADGVWMIVGVNVRCMSIATFAAERDEYDELVHEDLQFQGPITPGEE